MRWGYVVVMDTREGATGAPCVLEGTVWLVKRHEGEERVVMATR